MTLVLQYDIDTHQAQQFFTFAGQHARRMATPFSRVAGLARAMLSEQFETEGEVFPSPGYFQWAPLNPDYQSNKVDPRIGRFTSEMHDSAMRGVKFGNGWLEITINRYADDGTDIVEIFQEGRPATPQMRANGDFYMGGGQPPRPIWETTEGFKQDVQLIFWKWLGELKSMNARHRKMSFGFDGLEVQPTYMWH